MAELEQFTVTSNGIGAIQVDYVDAGVAPDEEIVFAFVDFVPREKPGTVHWLSGLSMPRGIQLDTIRGRFSDQDGKLRTIIGHPTNERQLVTVTGNPWTLTFNGVPTVAMADSVDPSVVQAALENLAVINVGDVYVSGKVQNEKQTVTVGAGATGGVLKLATTEAPTEWTDGIARNASASSVQAYLQALSTIGSDGCSVSGPSGGPWIVQFTGIYAGVNRGTLLADATGLTPAGRTVTVVQTVQGTTGTPFTVNFQGQFAAADVPQLGATNATVTTITPGTADLGVQLTANTPVLALGNDKDGNPVDLIYDVRFVVPDLDKTKPDRIVTPFAIAAPRVGGTTIDLADASLHLPPKGH